MILLLEYSCGEIDARNVKESPELNRINYIDACIGSTTKNKNGDFVKIMKITYGDLSRSII